MAVRSVGQAVRVSSAAYLALKEMASESDAPIARTLEALVQDAYQRRMWARFAESNRLAGADPANRTARDAEDALWAVADLDGLDPDEGVDWDDRLEDAASW